MQLIIISIALFLLIFVQKLHAQVSQGIQAGNRTNSPASDSSKSTLYHNPNWRTVDVDFLTSYYSQEGDNAAVTGGIGTEQLTDFTQKIILRVPVKPRLSFNGNLGYDYYSSASTDNIDNVPSSDSASDLRFHGSMGAEYRVHPQHTVGMRLGGSGEYDYMSLQGGLNYSYLSKDENTALSLRFQAFSDKWFPIYPSNVPSSARNVPTENRQSYNLSVGLQKVIDRRTQVSVQLEGVLMQGLLSTPFHRVYFAEQVAPTIERLPDLRIKIPVGIRVNRYMTDWMIARAYYRFYWDNWGILGHTASLELPLKPTRFIAIIPSYRFHTQTAAQYFAPYKTHSLGTEFYTSDHDLAALNSHTFGLGVSYQPSAGIFKLRVHQKRNRYLKFKNVDLRYAHYRRSTGLTAHIVSFGVGFSLE